MSVEFPDEQLAELIEEPLPEPLSDSGKYGAAPGNDKDKERPPPVKRV